MVKSDYEARRAGAALRALRQARGIRVNALAPQLGITPAHLTNIEAGRKRLTAERVALAAAALGCDPIALAAADLRAAS